MLGIIHTGVRDSIPGQMVEYTSVYPEPPEDELGSIARKLLYFMIIAGLVVGGVALYHVYRRKYHPSVTVRIDNKNFQVGVRKLLDAIKGLTPEQRAYYTDRKVDLDGMRDVGTKILQELEKGYKKDVIGPLAKSLADMLFTLVSADKSSATLMSLFRRRLPFGTIGPSAK